MWTTVKRVPVYFGGHCMSTWGPFRFNYLRTGEKTQRQSTRSTPQNQQFFQYSHPICCTLCLKIFTNWNYPYMSDTLNNFPIQFHSGILISIPNHQLRLQQTINFMLNKVPNLVNLQRLNNLRLVLHYSWHQFSH